MGFAQELKGRKGISFLQNITKMSSFLKYYKYLPPKPKMRCLTAVSAMQT